MNFARRRCEVTHGDDLGEDDGEHGLYRPVDGGADDSDENVRPLGFVQAQHSEERHRRCLVILLTGQNPVSRFVGRRDSKPRMADRGLASTALIPLHSIFRLRQYLKLQLTPCALSWSCLSFSLSSVFPSEANEAPLEDFLLYTELCEKGSIAALFSSDGASLT